MEAAAADPATSAAVAAGLVLLPYSIAAYQRFAGYAGDLAPLKTSFILQAR